MSDDELARDDDDDQAMRITPKGMWVVRRMREIAAEAFAHNDFTRMGEAFEQAVREFESGDGYNNNR
jgi:hypothetical protein